MLPLRVNFYASLRKIAGTKTVEFSLAEGSTVEQLLHAIIARYPNMRHKLLDENGELDRHAHIIVNGRYSPLLEEGNASVIMPDDKVDVFPIGHF